MASESEGRVIVKNRQLSAVAAAVAAAAAGSQHKLAKHDVPNLSEQHRPWLYLIRVSTRKLSKTEEGRRKKERERESLHWYTHL